MGVFGGGDVFWCAGDEELATTGAAFGAEVENPIGGFDHIEVVFNDHDGVAVVAQAMQHLE